MSPADNESRFAWLAMDDRAAMLRDIEHEVALTRHEIGKDALDQRVMDAMAAVPREEFVPTASRGVAYIDRALPLENGRRIAAPLFYGMVLAEARPAADDRVLVVDSGAGYLPELLRPLVAAIEVISPDDAVAASRKKGDFSLLVIDGAVEALPAALVKRLAPGARVVTGLVAAWINSRAIETTPAPIVER